MFHEVIAIRTCSSNTGNFVANLKITGITFFNIRIFFDKHMPSGVSPYPNGGHLVKILANNPENANK